MILQTTSTFFSVVTSIFLCSSFFSISSMELRGNGLLDTKSKSEKLVQSVVPYLELPWPPGEKQGLQKKCKMKKKRVKLVRNQKCSLCPLFFTRPGIKIHERACKKKHKERCQQSQNVQRTPIFTQEDCQRCLLKLYQSKNKDQQLERQNKHSQQRCQKKINRLQQDSESNQKELQECKDDLKQLKQLEHNNQQWKRDYQKKLMQLLDLQLRLPNI